MAKEAEAERERRAKIVAGEYQAAVKLGEAADIITQHSVALQLRTLQTMAEISVMTTVQELSETASGMFGDQAKHPESRNDLRDPRLEPRFLWEQIRARGREPEPGPLVPVGRTASRVSNRRRRAARAPDHQSRRAH